MIADGAGRAIAFRVAPGQAHELPHAIPLLERLPGVPKWVVGDRGYGSHGFREHIWDVGSRPAIPSKRNEALVACPDWIYNNRNTVERLWARLKEWRAVATRYEKTARSFLGVLSLAATIDWIKRWQALAGPGMLDPTRVRGFLDVFGSWDPSLAFVLAGAVTTSFLGVRLARLVRKPVLTNAYDLPANRRVDARLVGGAIIFGVGWGASGLCPGPAVADLALGSTRIVAFVAAMLVGMAAFLVLQLRNIALFR